MQTLFGVVPAPPPCHVELIYGASPIWGVPSAGAPHRANHGLPPWELENMCFTKSVQTKKKVFIQSCQTRIRIRFLGRPALAPVRILFGVILSPPWEIIYHFFTVQRPIWGNFETPPQIFLFKSGANAI